MTEPLSMQDAQELMNDAAKAFFADPKPGCTLADALLGALTEHGIVLAYWNDTPGEEHEFVPLDPRAIQEGET